LSDAKKKGASGRSVSVKTAVIEKEKSSILLPFSHKKEEREKRGERDHTSYYDIKRALALVRGGGPRSDGTHLRERRGRKYFPRSYPVTGKIPI